jgi:hypothetical protein
MVPDKALTVDESRIIMTPNSKGKFQLCAELLSHLIS